MKVERSLYNRIMHRPDRIGHPGTVIDLEPEWRIQVRFEGSKIAGVHVYKGDEGDDIEVFGMVLGNPTVVVYEDQTEIEGFALNRRTGEYFKHRIVLGRREEKA